MINYLQSPVRMVGSNPGEPFVGKLKEVQGPIVQIHFLPSRLWRAGEVVSLIVDHETEPMTVEGVVLANEPSGTLLWATHISIGGEAEVDELQDTGLVYVTVNCLAAEHRALVRHVSSTLLCVELTERVPIGAEVLATVHVGMVPILIPCRVTWCHLPLGSAHIMTRLEVTNPSCMSRARWDQYVEGLELAPA
jgi:hypothetical protein